MSKGHSDESWRADLIELTDSLCQSHDVNSLQSNYFLKIQSLIEADVYGVYLFGQDECPTNVYTFRAHPDFLRSYEIIGRNDDPVFAYVTANQRSVHEQMLLSARDWTQNPMGRLLGNWDLCHLLEGPLTWQGQMIGTLNFARNFGGRPFSDQDVTILDRVCRQMSFCNGTLLEISKARGVLDTIESHSNLGHLPLIITNGSREVLAKNEHAKEFVAHYDKNSRNPRFDKNLPDIVCSGESSVQSTATYCQKGVPFSIGSFRLAESNGLYLHLLYPESKHPPLRDVHTATELTHREQEVFALVAQGMRNRDIARRLFISENTVKFHIKQLYRKLNVNSRVDLAKLAPSWMTMR